MLSYLTLAVKVLARRIKNQFILLCTILHKLKEVIHRFGQVIHR